MTDKQNSLHQKIHNTPHLMTNELFSSVEKFIDADGDIKKEASICENRYKLEIEDLQYNEDTGVGILPIIGMLTYDESYYWWMDTTSYKSLLDNAKTMLEAGASTIVLDVDSGGGLAYGMMETASLLRKMVDDYNAKLISYNDGISASAAYGLSCVAHEFIANPDAETGSIGVVVSLVDYSEYDKKNGIKRIYKTAGDGKVPYTDSGGFTKEFLDDIQSKVDKVYDRFTSHVAQYREVTQDEVKSLGAKVYTSDEALSNGLIDKIMTREEFFNYLAEVSSNKGTKQSMSIGSYFNKTQKKDTKMSKETEQVALQAALEAAKVEFEKKMSADMEALKASLSAEFAQKLEAKDSELAAAKEKLASMEQEKAEAKAAERKATLSAIVGDVQAEAKAEEFAELSDKAFASMVEMLKQAKAASEESELMTEIGDQGQPVVEEEVDVLKAAQEKLALRRKEKFNKKGAN